MRRDSRARRYTLRLDQKEGRVALVVPGRASIAEGLAFAERKAAWIERQLKSLPPAVPFLEGAALPLLGVEHVIRHQPGARRGTWAEDGEIRVSGQPEHLARRVKDFLKSEARRSIEPRCLEKAARLERRVARVSLRDTTSRWGSCTHDGRLSFSWRLVLAPESVLDYVVAHEVAHLVHMDHSKRFWSVVATLTEEVETPRAWLRAFGAQLHRYG